MLLSCRSQNLDLKQIFLTLLTVLQSTVCLKVAKYLNSLQKYNNIYNPFKRLRFLCPNVRFYFLFLAALTSSKELVTKLQTLTLISCIFISASMFGIGIFVYFVSRCNSVTIAWWLRLLVLMFCSVGGKSSVNVWFITS